MEVDNGVEPNTAMSTDGKSKTEIFLKLGIWVVNYKVPNRTNCLSTDYYTRLPLLFDFYRRPKWGELWRQVPRRLNGALCRQPVDNRRVRFPRSSCDRWDWNSQVCLRVWGQGSRPDWQVRVLQPEEDAHCCLQMQARQILRRTVPQKRRSFPLTNLLSLSRWRTLESKLTTPFLQR